MAKYCADCSNLDVKDKKGEGICKCKKIGKHVPANTPCCEKFQEAYTRRWYDREKLYDDAKNTLNKPSDDNISVGTYWIVAVVIIVIAIIANIFMK